MADTVKEAMRAELRKVLDEELSFKSLERLIRLAKAAKQFMYAGDVLEKGGDIYGDGGEQDVPNGPSLLTNSGSAYALNSDSVASMNSETYGAKLIREALAALPGLMRMQKETPEGLVRAIAEAQSAGLNDVARELKGRLGIEPEPKAAETATLQAVVMPPPVVGSPMPATFWPPTPPATPPPAVPGPPLTTTPEPGPGPSWPERTGASGGAEGPVF